MENFSKKCHFEIPLFLDDNSFTIVNHKENDMPNENRMILDKVMSVESQDISKSYNDNGYFFPTLSRSINRMVSRK